jgi:hypothetical protein
MSSTLAYPLKLPVFGSLPDAASYANRMVQIATGVYWSNGVTWLALGSASSAPPFNSITANLPAALAVFDHQQTFNDASITPASKIELLLDPGTDSDENQPEGLYITAMTARPAAGSFLLVMEFGEPTSGPIKLFYQVN